MSVWLNNAKQIRFPTQLKYTKTAREFIQEVMVEVGVPQSLHLKIMLAVDEAVGNAINHGGSNTGDTEIILTCRMRGTVLEILVEDFGGKPFDPTYFERIAKAKTWGKGGRGILLINRIMDEVMYIFEEGKSTLVYMAKDITREVK
ncbi:MAG: ATP-binding protein [Gemmatimonadetes bacterium]|nr:MAG: ATP-binding protein [Gemmatimonadota bacterium]